MSSNFYTARSTHCFILMYTCSLTVVTKRISYAMLCQCVDYKQCRSGTKQGRSEAKHGRQRRRASSECIYSSSALDTTSCTRRRVTSERLSGCVTAYELSRSRDGGVCRRNAMQCNHQLNTRTHARTHALKSTHHDASAVSNSNKCIAVRKVATPLRELTCHTGSHSVTCHPAEVTFPPLPQPKLVLD